MTQAGAFATFLGDLRGVACVGAFGLYLLWALLQRPALAALARLGVFVAFGAAVAAYALAVQAGVGREAVEAAPPLVDLYGFALLAAFLLLEFLFQLSVLGLLATGLAAAVAAAGWLGAWPVAAAPPNPLVAYWGLLGDLVATAGAAALSLGVGAALLLRLVPDRRGGKLVHPNDLRDAAAMLGRLAAPAGWLALVGGGMALRHHPAPDAGAWAHAGALLALAVVSTAWWLQAESRRWTGRRVGLLLVLAVAAIAMVFLAGSALLHLTPAPAAP